MKEIQLTKGYSAIVDDEDYDFLMQWKWYARCQSAGMPYAARGVRGNPKKIMMHDVIMNNNSGLTVDHINLDRLDNRKENLRLCTRIENSRNHPLRKDSTSGYKGVSWRADIKKWRVQISIDGKQTTLGYFENKEDGYNAYCKKAIELFGEFARFE